MKPHPPRTPFSTPLSGSAQERKLRLVSIFQWKKKRPPTLLLCLCLAAGLLCGALASCKGAALTQKNEDWSTQTVLDALSPYGDLDESAPIQRTLLESLGNEPAFAAVWLSNSYPRYSLVMGLVNPDGTLAGEVFEARACGGRPYVQTFQKDGQEYLLYTVTGMQLGRSWGEAGVIRLDGDDFTWVWPVEGDVRDEQSPAYEEYQSYWNDHLPLMAPGGVEIFAGSGRPVSQGEGLQWVPDHNEQFFPSDYDTLPIPVPYQARVWLEEYSTQPENNPWNMAEVSAAWQITSLKADETRYPDQKDTEQAYILEARADKGSGETLTATLLFDQEEGQVTRAVEVLLGGERFALDISSLQEEIFSLLEAPAILEDLTLEDFPTRPIDLRDWENWEGWEDLVYLLREDKATDTALYGVRTPAHSRDEVLEHPFGLILRHGANWRFYPLDWGSNLWEGSIPDLFVGDSNGDGREEAALSILTGHGTGCYNHSLSLFDLDTLEHFSPDDSHISVTSFFDPETNRAILKTGNQQAVLDVSEYVSQYGAFTGVGSWICYHVVEDGVLWADFNIYITCKRLPLPGAYMVDIRFPLVFQDGQWQLGEGDLLHQSYYNWDMGLEAIQWTDEAGTTHIARNHEELLAAA